MSRQTTADELRRVMDQLDTVGAPAHLVTRTAILVTRTPRKAAERLADARQAAENWSDVPANHAEATREAEALETALAVLDRCRRCGAHLSDPVSVRRGLGPECVKHGT